VTGVAGVLSVLLVLGSIVVSLRASGVGMAPDCLPENSWDQRCEWFDSLLDLAVATDPLADAEPTWTDVRPTYGDDLGQLTTIILNGLQDYGFAAPHRPVSVSFADYGDQSSKVAGRYYEDEDRITLNNRYLSDPVWQRRGYLKVLTHELIHAQGYQGEVQTEAIALQVVAGLGNQGEPGFRRAALEELRNDALWSAYDIAVHHAYFVADDDVRPPCTSGLDDHGYTCDPQDPPNEAMHARLDAVRQQVLDPIELRYSDYRARWWEDHEIDLLMSSYVMPPLAFTLNAYCQAPHQLPSGGLWQPIAKAGGNQTTPPLPTDEADYLLTNTGWRCPTWLQPADSTSLP
jgi:hypothetical protein